MNDRHEDPRWQRLSEALFKPRQMKDRGVFTAGVMARIRDLQPADLSWRLFARWAIPALALSLGGFIFALNDWMEPLPVTSETIVLGDPDALVSIEWLASSPESLDASDHGVHS